jgi:NAD(P)-dependent dehydrogenase (short-subunit alcohol dehydrogenase family)
MRVLFALLAAPMIGIAQPVETNSTKAVLVTGASSGIGRKITERLAADGYFVYATARNEADLKTLRTHKNVQPVRLDVTQPAEIAAALETVTRAGRGLYGLVNNAGVATVGSIADMNFEEFDLTMKVNAYGPVRMIQAFDPLIISQKGRIINISSISGILATRRLPAYSMSKHAIEALTDSAADQLAPLGVRVSVVEPGNYNSNILKNAIARDRMDPQTVKDLKAVEANPAAYEEPDEVAVAVEHALFDPNPKRRYMIVPKQDEAERTIRKQIEQLVQLNEGQPYSYDRAALIKMLDDALATSRAATK